MSDTTKTPRPHAEMASRYMADTNMNCWGWNDTEQRWRLVASPCWYAHETYEVCEHRPTHKPKRRVTLAGITFDEPEMEEPKVGAKYWVADVDSTHHFEWSGSPVEQRWLAAGLVHLDKENARLHALALRELNRQLCGLGDVQ